MDPSPSLAAATLKLAQAAFNLTMHAHCPGWYTVQDDETMLVWLADALSCEGLTVPAWRLAEFAAETGRIVAEMILDEC
jgi:hypothetical protein